MRLRSLAIALLAMATLLVSTPVGATPTPLPTGETRLAGADRYATAAAISKASFEGPVDSVFVASGLDYPDALSAGPAAAALNAPILLVGKGSVNAHTKAELDRLRPKTIYVTGGPKAVDEQVATELGRFGQVVRLQGLNRYATAATISKATWRSAKTVIVASGDTFADGLAGGPAAARLNAPMLLSGTKALPAATRAELRRLRPTSVYILGGTAALSSAVQQSIAEAVPEARIRRLAGPDRYQTSAAIARHFWSSMPTMFFATGLTFPDAVVGTPAAAVNDAPIILTEKSCMPPPIAQLKREFSPRTVAILGGTGVVASGGVRTTCLLPGQYKGVGDAVRSITKPGGQSSMAIATLTHSGRSNFIVWGLTSQLTEVDLLVNEIGDYSGTVLIPSNVTRLEITADGPWTVHVKSMSKARSFGSGTISGRGDDVIRWTGGTRTVRLTHDGDSNFIVWGLDNAGWLDSLYVNEIGTYSGTKAFRSSSRWLSISADGRWTMRTS